MTGHAELVTKNTQLKLAIKHGETLLFNTSANNHLDSERAINVSQASTLQNMPMCRQLNFFVSVDQGSGLGKVFISDPELLQKLRTVVMEQTALNEKAQKKLQQSLDKVDALLREVTL